MGLFLCDMCDEQLSFDKTHVCDPNNIRKYVNGLQDAARLAERRLDDMQNAVLMIVQELPSLDGEKITVNAEWLRRLWNATKCQWYEAKTPEQFLVCWLVTHRILCEAYDLFRSKKYGKVETTLEKLKALREACDDSKEVLGYQDSKFDLAPEELL